MSIIHVGTSIFLNAKNHKAIPVREQSKKLDLLSLLFCYLLLSLRTASEPQALGLWLLPEDTGAGDLGHCGW